MNRSVARIGAASIGSAGRGFGIAVAVAMATLWTSTAGAQVLAMSSTQHGGSIGTDGLADRSLQAQTDANGGLPAKLRRQIVEYPTAEAPGTVIVDTPHTFLYFVLGGGRAIRYEIGVGRDGFTWWGTKTIERMASRQ